MSDIFPPLKTFQNVEFTQRETTAELLEAYSVYRYVSFIDLDFSAGVVEGVFIGAQFDRMKHYWGIYTQAIIIDSDFRECTFQGTAFNDCLFIRCNFANCTFGKDSAGADCDFTGTSFIQCIHNDSSGLPF